MGMWFNCIDHNIVMGEFQVLPSFEVKPIQNGNAAERRFIHVSSWCWSGKQQRVTWSVPRLRIPRCASGRGGRWCAIGCRGERFGAGQWGASEKAANHSASSAASTTATFTFELLTASFCFAVVFLFLFFPFSTVNTVPAGSTRVYGNILWSRRWHSFEFLVLVNGLQSIETKTLVLIWRTLSMNETYFFFEWNSMIFFFQYLTRQTTLIMEVVYFRMLFSLMKPSVWVFSWTPIHSNRIILVLIWFT